MKTEKDEIEVDGERFNCRVCICRERKSLHGDVVLNIFMGRVVPSQAEVK